MCTLCALVFVLNSRGAQHASAEGSPPDEAAEAACASSVSAAYLRLCEAKPEVDIGGWQYTLYTRGCPVIQEPPQTVRVGGVPVDARIAEDLQRMISDARAQGLGIYLSCGYTDAAAQEHIYQRAVEKYGAFHVQSIVGRPEENEHRSGLAVDITDRWYGTKTADALRDNPLSVWMAQHCQEYGFILRFPEGKEDITKVMYEPWHFRYVGVDAATYIMANNLTLEEFVGLYA